MRSPTRRAGLSLFELLLGVAMAAVALGAAWGFLGPTVRTSARTSDKLTALQQVLLTSLRLQRDLRALRESAHHPVAVSSSPAGCRLSFHRYGADVYDRRPARGHGPSVEAVTYAFDAGSHRLTRRADPAPGAEPPRAGLAALSAAALDGEPAVLFLCGGVPARDTGPRGLPVAVVGAVPRTDVAVKRAYPAWNEIPYVPASR